MLDVMSGGRLIAGLVVGGGPEYYSTNVNPTDARPRFREAVELVIEAWTRPGPFAFDGEYYQLPYVNPWPRPLQQPHPPVWIPGLGSPSTITYCVEHGFGYMGVAYYAPPETFARQAVAYHDAVAASGRTFDPELLGLAHHGLRGRDRRAGRRGSRHPPRLLPGDPGGGLRRARQGVDAAGLHRPARPRAVPGRPPGHGAGPAAHRCRRRGVEAIAADRQPGHGPRAAARLRERARAWARSWRCCNSGRSPPS